MTLRINLKDGRGSNNLAGVSNAGELIVAGIGDNMPAFNAMNVVATAFNFFPPMSNANLFITSILANVPSAATNIDIYEAGSSTSIVVDKEILSINTSGKALIPISFPFGGFPMITEGEFLNAKTDNTVVNMTIIGYYRTIIE